MYFNYALLEHLFWNSLLIRLWVDFVFYRLQTNHRWLKCMFVSIRRRFSQVIARQTFWNYINSIYLVSLTQVTS